MAQRYQKRNNMYPDDQELSNVRLKVGLLEKDVEVLGDFCGRITDSIEKIQDMNQNVINMITLHGQRHEQHDRVEQELKEDIKELHSRITTVNREIHDRIDQVEHHISSRIDALRSDLANHKKQDGEKGKISERIAKLEQWQWMAAGAIAFVAWAIGQSDFIGKLFR